MCLHTKKRNMNHNFTFRKHVLHYKLAGTVLVLFLACGLQYSAIQSIRQQKAGINFMLSGNVACGGCTDCQGLTLVSLIAHRSRSFCCSLAGCVNTAWVVGSALAPLLIYLLPWRLNLMINCKL